MPTLSAISWNSSGETVSRVLPRRLRCSFILTAFSCMVPWVSSVPPTSLKLSPVVMRVWPSLLSSPSPNNMAFFLDFTGLDGFFFMAGQGSRGPL